MLYWFGHAPLSRLGDGHGDVAIVGGDLPDLFLLPTGEMLGKDGVVVESSEEKDAEHTQPVNRAIF